MYFCLILFLKQIFKGMTSDLWHTQSQPSVGKDGHYKPDIPKIISKICIQSFVYEEVIPHEVNPREFIFEQIDLKSQGAGDSKQQAGLPHLLSIDLGQQFFSFRGIHKLMTKIVAHQKYIFVDLKKIGIILIEPEKKS